MKRKPFSLWMLMLALVLVFATNVNAKDVTVEKATLASGCFWGVEKIFSKLPGVLSTRVGYTGGKKSDPSYKEICTTDTGHAEAIEITFDPARISYDDILIHFFSYHDPTTVDRQGPDIGSQYRSAIFYHSAGQEKKAKRAVELLTKNKVFSKKIVTEISPAGIFYNAEEYHQKYLEKNPNGYCSIHFQSDKVEKVLKESE